MTATGFHLHPAPMITEDLRRIVVDPGTATAVEAICRMAHRPMQDCRRRRLKGACTPYHIRHRIVRIPVLAAVEEAAT